MNPYRALLVKWTPHPSFAKVGKAVIGPLDNLFRPTGHAVSRPADDAERDEIWRKGLEVFPAFQDYAHGMTRTMDVFILEPDTSS